VPRPCPTGLEAALRTVILAVFAAAAAPAADPAPSAPPPAEAAAADAATEASRKAEVLAGSRWRRAMHELDEWLSAQTVYPPDRVRQIKAELAERVAGMTSYELEYLLDGLDQKLKVLETPAAKDARDWLGRYLSVMADDRRAALLARVPDVLDMSADELAAALAEIEEKRAKVDREASNTRRSRREFGAFIGDARRAEAVDRDRLERIRRGDAAFSPYRVQPVGSPPHPESFDSPTVVGVGPWGTFVDVSFAAF
jgi:hypothetical protein